MFNNNLFMYTSSKLKYLFFITITAAALQSLCGNAISNEFPWTGTAVGSISSTSESIPDVTATPGQTNVLLMKLRLYNEKGSSNADGGGIGRPNLAQVKFSFIGTALDTDFVRTQLWFDHDGVWNSGDEQEFRTNIIRSTNNNSKFSANFSPFTLQSGKAVFGTLSSQELALYHGWKETIYLYLTADFSTNIIDRGSVVIKIPEVNLFWRVSDLFWDQNMAVLNNNNTVNLQVSATKLVIAQEPQNPGIPSGELFSIQVSAKDQWGNTDLDFTGNVWLESSDPLAVLPYTFASPLSFAGGSMIVSNIRLYSGPTALITASDGAASGLADGLSRSILVIGDADHYTLTSGTNALPVSPVITAGAVLSSIQVSTITVSVYNYLKFINSNYTGKIYFYSSASNTNDTFPATAVLPYQFTGSGDSGRRNFSGTDFILTKAGVQNLIVTDGAHKGEWLDITVRPGAYSAIHASILSVTNLAGVPLKINLQASDKWGNALDSLSARIGVSITGTNNLEPEKAVYPQVIPLSADVKVLSDNLAITINSSGNYIIDFFDINNSAIRTSLSVVVNISLEKDNQIFAVNNFQSPGLSEEIALFYELNGKASAVVNITIFSMTGKVLRKYTGIQVLSGFNQLPVWDLRDSRGQKTPAGQYIIQIEGEGVETVRTSAVVIR